MAFTATVLNVLIASPSDVHDERNAIAQSLQDWNSLNAQTTGKVLLPVMWETHSAPAMGDRPQALINDQVVKSCDMLIGSFWTRLGSPTGVAESGTVEEIRYFLREKKPVMLYFSQTKADPNSIDLGQLDKLRKFRESLRGQGLQEYYSSLVELKEKLSRHLTIVVRATSVETVVDTKAVKEAKRLLSDDMGSTRTSGASEPMRLVDYTEKAFVLKGDSKIFKDALKENNGKWIKLRAGGHGWMFAKRHLEKIAQLIGVPPNLDKH